jgi:NAD+ diphosphatase
MIGATAIADSDQLTIDHHELDDACWFTRAEVAAALDGASDAAFVAPPRFAIARTLIEHWLRTSSARA